MSREMVVFLLLQKYIVGGLLSGSVKQPDVMLQPHHDGSPPWVSTRTPTLGGGSGVRIIQAVSVGTPTANGFSRRVDKNSLNYARVERAGSAGAAGPTRQLLGQISRVDVR